MNTFKIFNVPITNLISCGLQKPPVIRLKLFTIDHRLVIDKIGTLAYEDQDKVKEHMALVFAALL